MSFIEIFGIILASCFLLAVLSAGYRDLVVVHGFPSLLKIKWIKNMFDKIKKLKSNNKKDTKMKTNYENTMSAKEEYEAIKKELSKVEEKMKMFKSKAKKELEWILNDETKKNK